jgi:hypothetical protein
MGLNRRRLRWVLALASVVLIGLGVWFYRFYFCSFDAEIKPSLGLGMLINPTAWLQNEEIKLRDIRVLPRDHFLEALRDTADASPHGAVLVVLHGFRGAYESALRKTAFLGHVLDIDTPVLLFDWPGNQGSSLRGYRRARAVAMDSGAELAETLELVIRDVRPRQLWVMANSMGAQVVVDVTPVNRTRNFHNFSLDTPEFFDDLYLRLTNPEIPNSRPIYHIETPEGAVYSVLT